MFDNLTERLSGTLRKWSGQSKLTEANIQEALKEVKVSLLEADVALPVVEDLIQAIKAKALGQKVLANVTPGQAFVKVVQDELVHIMGDSNAKLKLGPPPSVVLMAGLQGAGKTTTVAKLALHLKRALKKKVLVVSADVYRPAAIKQLETLAAEVGADFFPSTTDEKPVDIAKAAIARAKVKHHDVVIVDTAGRLAIDEAMMDEIQGLQKAIRPNETLFVVDAMTGQDAANTAKAFNEALELTGVVLTKADGDARGGAALSVKHIVGKPIKFIGVSEKIDGLEAFHPDRIVSRILGMGDILTLVEQAEQSIGRKRAGKLARQITKGRGFDMNDLLEQFAAMEKIGGVAGMLDKLPGMPGASAAIGGGKGDKMLKRMEAMILSMTPEERSRPDIISTSRKKRIAAGSGHELQDVNRLLKQHKQMQKMMKKMTKGGVKGMMRGLGGMMGGGGMPPGAFK